MKSPRKLWEAYQLSIRLNSRPSDLYKIEGEVLAWSFDRAVVTFGQALENKLQAIARKCKKQADADRKTQSEFNKWMNSGPEKKTKGRFRDPMSLGGFKTGV